MYVCECITAYANVYVGMYVYGVESYAFLDVKASNTPQRHQRRQLDSASVLFCLA